MINEWLCDMSHCCHQTWFWVLNAPKMRSRPRTPLGELTALPQTPSCVWGGRLHFAAGKGRGRAGRERVGKGNGPSQQMDAHVYNSSHWQRPLYLLPPATVLRTILELINMPGEFSIICKHVYLNVLDKIHIITAMLPPYYTPCYKVSSISLLFKSFLQ